jgi:hypothetical protein
VENSITAMKAMEMEGGKNFWHFKQDPIICENLSQMNNSQGRLKRSLWIIQVTLLDLKGSIVHGPYEKQDKFILIQDEKIRPRPQARTTGNEFRWVLTLPVSNLRLQKIAGYGNKRGTGNALISKIWRWN